jgi:uncharacterized protein
MTHVSSPANRERSLAVFCCATILLLAATLLLLAACGQTEKKPDAAESFDSADVYSMEVRKDRLEKDKYLLTSPNTPVKASDMELFRGLAYYDVDRAFVFETVLQRLPVPAEVTIATSQDRPRIMLHLGALPFTYDGKEYAVQVFAPKDTSDGNYWFIPFTDATSGGETYGGGRYLDIDDIASDTVFLDFNYAYSPYCAYNERYDCPIPPPENALPVAIRAGERSYPLRKTR